MTLTLWTGAPGHGKTLSAVAELLANEIPSGRPIFLNIDGFDCDKYPNVSRLDDPETWHQLPERSLVVVDECQHWFAPRHYSKPVPDHVAAVAEHRHRGQDLWLITQHPSSIDVFARHRVGRHIHLFRSFNLAAATRYEWQVCNDDPMPGQSAETALVKRVRFDRKLYGAYVSAVEHNMKVRLPWRRIAALVAALSVAVGAVAFAWFSLIAPRLHAGELREAASAELPISETTGAEPGPCRFVFVGYRAGLVELRDRQTGGHELRRTVPPGGVCRGL